jgi:hypothetical protein
MKKLFFALAMAFSFILVSCGSKNVETETEVDVVEVIEVEDEFAQTTDEVVDDEGVGETSVVE